MRMRSKQESSKMFNKAYLLPKTYRAGNVVDYAEIGQLFKYGNYQGKKTTTTTEVRVIENSDSGRKIITNSSLPFKRDDRISINGEISLITTVEKESAFTYGAIRNRRNRNVTILTLS